MGGGRLALNVLIWWAMMPGMMLPSAAPMILTFATVNRRQRERGQPYVPSLVFTAGYLDRLGRSLALLPRSPTGPSSGPR